MGLITKFFGKGIKVASGFDLGAKSPLDSRIVVNTHSELDEHVNGNRAYVGLNVYVIDEDKYYTFNGTSWNPTNNIKVTVEGNKLRFSK